MQVYIHVYTFIARVDDCWVSSNKCVLSRRENIDLSTQNVKLIVNNHSKHVRNVLHCSSPCALKGFLEKINNKLNLAMSRKKNLLKSLSQEQLKFHNLLASVLSCLISFQTLNVYYALVESGSPCVSCPCLQVQYSFKQQQYGNNNLLMGKYMALLERIELH